MKSKRKLLKWIGIIIGGFFLIMVIAAIASPSSQNSFNEGLQQGKVAVQGEFTQDKAIQKVQEYELQQDFSNANTKAGDTILTYYNNRGEILAVQNDGWYSEETDEEGKYLVGFRVTVGEMENLPQWEVTQDSILPLNGAAITLTPELQPERETNRESGTDLEKQVFDYANNLYRKYEQEAFDMNDANPNESPDIQSQRLVDAEERATRETAQHFDITEQEVIDIISKLQ